MKFISDWSIKKKMVTLVLFNIVVCTGIANVAVDKMIVAFKHRSLQTLDSYSAMIKDSIASQFFERYQGVKTVSSMPALKSGNKAMMESLFDSFVETYDSYDFFMLVDVNGKFVASNKFYNEAGVKTGRSLELKDLVEQNFSTAPWFQKVIKGEFSEDDEKGLVGVYVEDANVDSLVSSVYGEKRFGMGFSAPVKDNDGKLIGVLTVRTNFRFVEDQFVSTYKAAKALGAKDASFNLLNAKGELIGFHNPLANNGKEEYERNYDFILKKNVFEQEPAIVALAKAGKMDSIMGFGLVEPDVPHAIGFSPVKSKNFLDELGWSVVVRQNAEEAFREVNHTRNMFYFFSFCGAILLQMVSWWFSSNLSGRLSKGVQRLKQEATGASASSEQLSHSSQTVASSSTEQAAAIHETIAAMSEMTSMIAQTAQYTGTAYDSAQEASQIAEQGSDTMRRLAGSMEQIQQSNTQLEEVSRIIDEISMKTNVINDIVLKTQLLSFNASIEAARAGQHGRGFAVVAEEVGNLAQMSGNAAKEIGQLLESSKKNVSQIVQDMLARVDEGQGVSQEAQAKFNEVSLRISAITEQIESIKQASREQELGVQQTTKAMAQIDSSTQSNSTAAHESAQASESLKVQAQKLNHIARTLNVLILGTEGTNDGKRARDEWDAPGTGSGLDSIQTGAEDEPRSMHGESSEYSAKTILEKFIAKKGVEDKSKVGKTASTGGVSQADAQPLSADGDYFKKAG